MIPFHERRRQQFITDLYFQSLKKHLLESESFWSTHTPEADSSAQAKSLATASIARDAYMLLSLDYSAGEPIEPLRYELEKVIEAYETYTKFKRIYEQDEQHTPLYFAEIDEYERCLQLIALCYLLHRRDLIPRIAAMEDPNYYGHDVVYEEFLAYALDDRYDTDQIFHKKCYEPLLAAMYEETDANSIQDIKKYCSNWFPSLKKAPWHNSHLRMTETDGNYFGYWAFEAGAMVYLLKLDDSTIDHMVYPRDLVAWARANEHLLEETENKLRCEADQPCPKTGYWWTPAKQNSRAYFKQGNLMPDFPNSSYGETIWQWSPDQDDSV